MTLFILHVHTSAPLVKINSTFLKHKVGPRQPASPVHRARYSTNWDGKVDPARKFNCTTAADASAHILIFICITQQIADLFKFFIKHCFINHALESSISSYMYFI